MFLIFGFGTKAYPLGWVAMTCPVCRRAGTLLLVREVTKLSLFFIPLVPLRTRHVVQCPMCGSRTRVSSGEARRLLQTGVTAPL